MDDAYLFVVPDRLIWEHWHELLEGDFLLFELEAQAREREELISE